jgi:hypothetical protein
MTKAEYGGGHQILLTCNDGLSGVVDFTAWLEGRVFDPLKDVVYFQRFFIDAGTLTWPNGAAVAPERLYERAKSSKAA